MISHPNVIVVFIVLQLSGSFQVAPEESILLKKLLAGHSSDIRPLPKDLTGPTVVNITVRIVQILDIDERNEVLSMLTWATMQWEDSTFTWDPGANSNIHNLVFPAGNIWVPDVFIHNTQEISAGFHLGLPQNSDDAPFLAKAEANGLISLGFPHIIRSSCKLNISEYPFDTQYCPVTLGSWTHDKSELVINIVQDQFIKENQFGKQNKAWQQTSSECKKTKTECPFDQTSNECNVVQCFVGLKRTAWFEVISYTLPTIVIAVLSIMVFMVPPEAGKRMEVGITLILCIAVYLSLINKKMPPTSESFPLVSKFYGCIIVEITIAMVCSCYCLHIYDPEGLRLLHFPNYLRTLAFGVLARITFYQTKGGKPSRIHPTNAEIKIVERRRKSMLAMNSTLQLNAAAHGPRTFSVKPTDNKHFGVKIEDKKDNPQAQQQPYAQVQQQQHINQTLAENNNQMDSSNEEAYEAPAADLQLADIEEESEEDLLEQQENQPIGENRCDSGFGEPGGSLSNRSSLVSSNSVRLPIETNSPVNEAICECGLPGCDGHGEVIENTNNPPDAVTEHQPTSESNQPDESKEDNNQVVPNSTEVKFIKRSKTTFIGSTSTTEGQGSLLSKKLSARPYTDSVLSSWKRRKYAKAFQPTVRSKASLTDFDLEKLSGPTSEAIQSISTHEREASGQASEGEASENVEKETAEGKLPLNKETSTLTRKGSFQDKSNINSSRKNSQISLNKNDAGSSPEPGTSGQENIEGSTPTGQEDNANINAQGKEVQASKPSVIQRQSFDQIELVDINDDECGDTNEINDQITETTVTEMNDGETGTNEECSAIETECTEKVENSANSTANMNSKVVDRPEEVEHDNVDSETENEEKGQVTRQAKKSTMDDPKVLFTRRHWDTLRNRVQRRITVKDVFGQILSPKETSPIVAIANVLLRDQRKYVMRTEWMTSAMIFNRFFIILLAFAVIISMLAVFMQSSRLRDL